MRICNFRFTTETSVTTVTQVYIYMMVGHAVWPGILTMVFFLPVAKKISGKMAKLNRGKMEAMDSRVKYMNEVLLAIKVVKAGAWERPVLETLAKKRGKRDDWGEVHRVLGLVIAAEPLGNPRS